MANTEILLSVVNNTPVVQRASLFKNNDTITNNPNSQKYSWDVTGFDFSTMELIDIEYKLIGDVSFSNKSITAFITWTIDSVVAFLNSPLPKIGTFYYRTINGSTYIFSFTTTYVYGDLTLT
jgi:hypothetical protein